MNKRQKEVIASKLEDEKAILKALEKNYTTALADIKKNIKNLQANPLTQSKAYQLDFQKQLEKQLTGILDNLQGKNFTSIADYLNTCYKQGFLGTMYDLQGQGVPLVLPIDQKQVLKAVQKTGDNIKLANKLGISTNELKKQVLTELQRGLATELSYNDIARNISNWGSSDMNRSKRIARTEGHRVQNEAQMDSLYGAKKKGADIVKQWDSTHDGNTRPTHQALDGQIRELDESFSASGASAPYPGGFGDPAEDCNCRCCMLQRARWAVKGESTYQKWNNETGGIIECSGYEDFKKKYLEAMENLSNYDITENGKYKILPYSNVSEYQDYIEPEFLAQKMTHADTSILWADDGGYIQNADGYKDINGFMRGLKDSLDNPKCQKTIDVLRKRTTNPSLQHDYVGYRKVQPSYIQDVLGIDTSGKLKSIGMPYEGFKDKKAAQSLVDTINSLVGTDKAFVSDKAVTSVSLCEKINFFTHRTVKFEIQMPKGTKGLISDNYQESEFIAKPDTILEILGAKVYNNDGKLCITIFSRMIQD
jgi:hypothetical protein